MSDPRRVRARFVDDAEAQQAAAVEGLDVELAREAILEAGEAEDVAARELDREEGFVVGLVGVPAERAALSGAGGVSVDGEGEGVFGHGGGLGE